MSEAELEAHLVEWIGGLLKTSLSGSLHEILANGEVLCDLVNTLKPGSVAKVHRKTRMVFKHVENVGMALKAMRALGLRDIHLFCTNDLLDGNMRPVQASLLVLSKL